MTDSEFFTTLSEFNDKKMIERERIILEITEAVQELDYQVNEEFCTIKEIMDSILYSKEFNGLDKRYYNPNFNINWKVENGNLPNQSMILICTYGDEEAFEVIWTYRRDIEEFVFDRFRHNAYSNNDLTSMLNNNMRDLTNKEIYEIRSQIINGLGDITGYKEALKENILRIIKGE